MGVRSEITEVLGLSQTSNQLQVFVRPLRNRKIRRMARMTACVGEFGRIKKIRERGFEVIRGRRVAD
jgi:hypothetical protein